MIKFKNMCLEKPYLILRDKYDAAVKEGQINVEAISIASYSKQKMEVDSRFVNLKFIDEQQFIFFTNYNSPKSISFDSHNQISALIFWESINTQIRIKANIYRTSKQYNQHYFKNRSPNKNALSISSNQSELAESYSEIKAKYNKIKKSSDLTICPDYWGGFAFTPYYFEFWEGHESRINKREAYNKVGNVWNHSFLQP